jgi:hypothetical protein
VLRPIAQMTRTWVRESFGLNKYQRQRRSYPEAKCPISLVATQLPQKFRLNLNYPLCTNLRSILTLLMHGRTSGAELKLF